MSRTPHVLAPGVAHSRRAVLLLLTGLIASGAPLPFTAVAVVPLAWAGVESVLSLKDRSRAQAPTRAILSGVVSLLLVCLLTLVVLLPYVVYDVAKNRQDCLEGANTAIATADCDAKFSAGLDSVLGGLLSSG